MHDTRAGTATRAALAAALGFFIYSTPAFAERPPDNAPRAFAARDTTSMLAQTAAVVEGTVASLEETFSQENGPWTKVTLTELVVHRGSVGDSSAPLRLEFWQMGGALPDGRILAVSTAPEFTVGKRYVLMLRNTAWNLSPVLQGGALRVEREAGREFLVGDEGGALTSLSQDGMQYSASLFAGRDVQLQDESRARNVQLPPQALSVRDFLGQLDGQIAARKRAPGGRFYSEPITWKRARPAARE